MAVKTKKGVARGTNLTAIQKRQANKIKKLQKSHSSYWITDVSQFVSDGTEEVTRDDKLVRLASIRRAIGNFVKIGSGDDIPVMFSSGKQSYTTGKVVVISASDNPSKFDSQVGLALHEASHIRYSKKSLAALNHPRHFFDNLYDRFGLTPKAINLYGQAAFYEKLHQDVHFVMNILEDRRIDTLTYRYAPGYRPYYTSLYKEYFATRQNKKIANSVESRLPVVPNYLFWIASLTTEYFDINALPNLDKIVARMDLKNILRMGDDDPNWDQLVYQHKYICADHNGKFHDSWEPAINADPSEPMPELFTTAIDVVNLIYDCAMQLPSASGKGKQKGKQQKGADGLPNLDPSGGSSDGEEMSDEEAAEALSDLTKGAVSASDIADALKKMRQFIEGETPKKKLNKRDRQRVDDLIEAQAELKEAGKDFGINVAQTGRTGNVSGNVHVPVIIYKEVNKNNVSKIPFGGTWKHRDSEQAVLDGFRVGARLAHAIRIMNDEKQTMYTRQNEGRIERRLLSGLGYEQENVFYRVVNETIRPVHVHLSIDASGSMSGDKWKKSMTLAVALAVAADRIRTMRVVIDIRGGLDRNAGIAIIYDSKKDKVTKLRDIVPYLSVCGSTPEGLCFEAIMESILERTGNERKYFINLSDGQPCYSVYGRGGYNSTLDYSGEAAALHTGRQITMMRDADVRVLSYFIETHAGWDGGTDRKLFRKMYGADASFIDPSSIPAIALTLNKLFIQ